MKRQSSILLMCLISGSLAKPAPAILEYKDSLGQYSFGYSAPGSARSEVRSIDGSTRGSYSYVDGLGNIQSARYTADSENGFQVVATNLPQAPRPVEDTPEVTAARINHLKALEAAAKLAAEHPAADEKAAVIGSALFQAPAVIDDTANLADGAESLAAAKSANVPESNPAEPQDAESSDASLTEIQARTKSGESPASEQTSHSVQPQNQNSNQANEAAAKSSAGENQHGANPNLLTPDQGRSKEPIQPSENSADVSSDSKVPAASTSSVVPGNLNLQTRISPEESAGAARTAVPEPSPLFVAQPSIVQGGNLYPALQTPAGTKMVETSEAEKPEVLVGTSSLPLPSANFLQSISQPQQYSNTIVSSVITPSHVYPFAYGIGLNPIFRQYNSYQYFPYGIL